MENVKFILASESVTRRKLLENAGLVFDAFPAQIDEEEIKKSLVAARAHPQERSRHFWQNRRLVK